MIGYSDVALSWHRREVAFKWASLVLLTLVSATGVLGLVLRAVGDSRMQYGFDIDFGVFLSSALALLVSICALALAHFCARRAWRRCANPMKLGRVGRGPLPEAGRDGGARRRQ